MLPLAMFPTGAMPEGCGFWAGLQRAAGLPALFCCLPEKRADRGRLLEQFKSSPGVRQQELQLATSQLKEDPRVEACRLLQQGLWHCLAELLREVEQEVTSR